MQFGIKGKHQQNHHSKPNVTDGGKSTFHYGSSTTGKTDQETQSPVLKIFTDMLAREKSFPGYRDPEKAALLRAEHKRDRDSKRDDRRGDDRKDDGKTATRDDSDERRPRTSKKNKKPRTAKNRPTSNPKWKETFKLKSKISCHCPQGPPPHLPVCDDACCQYDEECQQSSSKEDFGSEEKVNARMTTSPTRQNDADQDEERIYEQRERVRERNFKKKMDDTCSCASCVLKKMCRNDCICCCCVAFVFILSLFLAFVLVCKSIPCLRSKFNMFGPLDDLESDRLKRKIDVPADMQWSGLDKKHDRISNKWDYDRVPGHPVPHSMDSTSYGDINLSHESDLIKIIDPDKLSEIQGNHRLREFYKKLVTTDAEIRKLKKDYLFHVETSNSIPYPDRAKRSLDILKSPFRMFRPKRKKIKEITVEGKATKAAEVKEPNKAQENNVKMKETKDARVKRFDTNEDGLLIEKKKVSIRFVPNGRRTFKCSHAPKEINSYEKQVKNPFYQNTQRLDELLDKFLDKNDMDMMGEPYSRSMISMKKFKPKNINNEEKNRTPTKYAKAENDEKGDFQVNFNDAKNKMLKNALRNNNRKIQHLPVDDNFKSLDDQIAKSKLLSEHYSKNNEQTDLDDLEDFLNSHGGAAKAKAKAKPQITTDNTKKTTHKTEKGNVLIKGHIETTTKNYNLLMSISTMMYKDNDNPLPAKQPDDSHDVKDHAPVGRRLMQIEMDDDEEVSAMPASEQDGERRNRRYDDGNPNSIINPNWKGPMPLYPDELNSVNKPGPVIVTTKENPDTEQILFSGPKNRKYGFKSRGRGYNKDPKHITDVEYIEDYFRNKYNKVAEMAQAYSDYGVLNDKNDKNDKNAKSERVDQRFRNYVKGDSEKSKTVKLVGIDKSLSWNSPEEGFKLQLTPSSSAFDGIMKALKEHVKFTGTPDADGKGTTDTETTIEPFFVGHTFETTKDTTEVLDVKNILKVERPMDFEYRNFKKRSLKSVDYYQNDDPSDAIESLMNFRGIFNGLQKKFSTKLGSAQDYAIRVASDYIHDGIYKRHVDSVDVDVVSDSVADDNITVSENLTENDLITGIYNRTDAVKLVATDNDNSTPQIIDTGVKIATNDVRNDTGTTLSDFFMKLAHWFSLLDTLDLSANKSQQANFSATNNANEKAKDQPKFELSFPLYDADMIENIGHRSRVLLAVNESEPVDDRTPDGEGKGVADTKGVGVVETEIDNTTITNLEAVNAKDNKTKPIVKRNADGNLFWDDVYNDDYGADADNIDGSDARKTVQSYASKPAQKKNPKEWFKKIVTRLKDGVAKCAHKHGTVDKKGGHRKSGKQGKPKAKTPKPIQNLSVVSSRRFYRKADEYPTEEKKTDFTILTAKMKKICHKAAKDISLSKKLEVREESKEGQVASKLMQQLIGLMSDLVDYQVHEKTCRKLPMDLQNFLEWLTNPESTVMTYHGKDVMQALSNKEPIEEIRTLEAMPPEEQEPEPKADCMSVMSAVRDLLNRYDSLSDEDKVEDKSKMSGVKEYLDAQLEYLQKQMYMTNEFNLLNTDISRYKRDAKVSDPNHPLGKVKSVYVTFKKYMRKQNEQGANLTKKLYGSDHKSTTSKVMTIAVSIEKAPDIVISKNKIKEQTKRNLKDVYYRALEEAKLMTAATVGAKQTSAVSHNH